MAECDTSFDDQMVLLEIPHTRAGLSCTFSLWIVSGGQFPRKVPILEILDLVVVSTGCILVVDIFLKDVGHLWRLRSSMLTASEISLFRKILHKNVV